MSRLIYKGDTIANFGKYLPTPIIESLTLKSLQPSDSIVEIYNSRTSDALAIVADDVVKLEVKTSILFNSNDKFDTHDLFNEILYGPSPLYLNIFIAKDASFIQNLKDDKLSIRDIQDINGSVTTISTPLAALTDSDSEGGMSASDISDIDADYYNTLAPSKDVQVYSVPFSSFASPENLYTDFDENGNAVIRGGYTSQIFHIIKMEDKENITIFASVSTKRYDHLALTNLSRPVFALNFSDVTYEDLKINGKLAKFGDPIFVDETGLPYPNTPLQTIDGRYFKSENVTHEQIKQQIKQVINKYVGASNRAVQSQVDNYNFVLSTYGNTHELIPRLKKLNSLSPNKSSGNTVGIMYSELSKLINTINSVVISQEQVAKRIYRNYKIVDMRQIRSYSFSSSFREDLERTPNKFIYTPVGFNQARYIPVSKFADNPYFEAELPMGSEEFRERTNERIEELKTQLVDMVINARISRDDPGIESRLANIRNDLIDWMDKQGKILTIQKLKDEGQTPKTPHSKKKNKKNAKCLVMWDQSQYDPDNKKKKKREDDTYSNAKAYAKRDDIRGYMKPVPTKTLIDTHFWVGGGHMAKQEQYPMWELVFPYDRNRPLNTAYGVGGTPDNPFEGSTSSETESDLYVGDRAADIFYGNMYKAMDLRPPVSVSYSERTIVSKDYRYYAISYGNATGASFDNDESAFYWGEDAVDRIINALLYRIGTSYDVGVNEDLLADGFSGDSFTGTEYTAYREAVSEAIDTATRNASETLKYHLESKINAIRDSDSLLNSLRFVEERRAVAEQIWNSFSTTYTNPYHFKEYFGDIFKAYIRTPFDPSLYTGIRSGYSLPANYFDGQRLSVGTYRDGDLNVYYANYKGLKAYRSNVDFIKPIDMTNQIVGQMISNINAVRDSAISKIEEILTFLEARDGAVLDAGVHDALANIDIIIEKSGFFFFDMEKFIRTRSFASRYMDINKFSDFFPRAKDVLNRAIQVRKVHYQNVNFETELELQYYDPATQRNAFDVTEPQLMTFNTNSRVGGPLGVAPVAYHTAPQNTIGQGFSDYIVDTGGMDSEFTEIPTGGGTYPTRYRTSSKLVQRNFSFPGFANSDLTPDGYGNERTWIDDYRLYLYTYNFFIDDDLYNTPVSTVTGKVYPTTENSTVDQVMYTVTVEDHSLEIMQGLLTMYSDVYNTFIEEYYEPAIEQCSYNEYTQAFNNFFASAILNKHPTGAPWVRMVSTYISYINVFTDNFDDLIYADVLETSESILETIRPETGTLQQLINFKDMAQDFLDRFTLRVEQAEAFYDSGATPDTFKIVDIARGISKIETPILDHIGNYEELADVIGAGT